MQTWLAVSVGCAAALALGVLAIEELTPDPPLVRHTLLEAVDEQEETGVSDAEAADDAARLPEQAVIYVTVVSHNEDTLSPQYPDYTVDRDAFLTSREATLAFARAVVDGGGAYDFQTDWNFLRGIMAHDDVNNNVLMQLDAMGVQIDPHSHQNLGYTYGDVAAMIEELGVVPSGVVGGMVVAPPERSILESFWKPVRGKRYAYVWTPTVAWGGGTALHTDDTPLWASGVWRPAGADDFLTHDDEAPLPVIGHWDSTWDGLDALLALRAEGELDPTYIYTATIMTNQRDFDDDYTTAFAERLATYADEVADGAVVFATLDDVYTAWQTTYGGVGHVLKYLDVLDAPETSSRPARVLP